MRDFIEFVFIIQIARQDRAVVIQATLVKASLKLKRLFVNNSKWLIISYTYKYPKWMKDSKDLFAI